MAESRLQRWSRKKAEAGKDAGAVASSATEQTVESEASPEEQELAVNEGLSEHELLEKYDLPDPDAIELGTDITGFMRKEIPELLRRKALRSLWRSNPVLAVLDGLNDYDEDFTNAASSSNIVQTLYKVGRGFDRTPAVEEQPPAEEKLAEEKPVEEKPAEEKPAEQVGEQVADPNERVADSEVAVDSTASAPSEPRYRPRMRFDH